MAAGATYTPIATATASGSANTYTFSSITGIYTDLVLIVNGSSASANPNIAFQFNGDTGANYSRTWLNGNGTSTSSGRASGSTGGYIDNNSGLTTTANAYTNIVNFMNYSNTTTYKTVLSRPNNAGVATEAIVNLWRNTAAITSITLFTNSGVNFTATTTFTLYGIASA